MKKTFLLLVLAIASFSSQAQSRKEWIEYGDAAFDRKDYGSAAYFYLKVVDRSLVESKDIVYPYDAHPYEKPKKDTATAKAKNDSLSKIQKPVEPAPNEVDLRSRYVIHQVAESYRLNRDYEKAEGWYKKAAEYRSPQFPNDRYWYATVLMSNGKYEEAMEELQKYMAGSGDSESEFYRKAQQLSDACALGRDPEYTRKEVVIDLLDSALNTGTSNFAAAYYGSDTSLVFSSSRPDSKILPKAKDQDPRYLSDLYTTTRTYTVWSPARNLDMPVNSEMHEGAAALSSNKELLFFTRWNPNNKDECGIYVSRFLNGNWLQPVKMNSNVNRDGYQSKEPTISEDGTTLYFSSNRPGGKGKFDIWYCRIDEQGNPEKAVNLGENVNTSENEVSPFFHQYTQTLYFSSDGHKGLGGLDIFKSYASDVDTVWSTPINMKRPINSGRDDAYFILQKNQRSGFFTSDRNKCKSCNTNYCYQLFSLSKAPNVFSIKGHAYNKETNEPLANALVSFKDVTGDIQPFFVITQEDGSYYSPLPEGVQFYMKAQKRNFFGDGASVSTIGLTESQEFNQDFYLTPIPKGDITIPGIEYDYDKATLRPESKKILDDLVDFLNLNDNITIELSSHTDTRGKDEYNLKLSQERAKSVVDYLVSKGIVAERLQAEGYGETKPLITDAEINAMKTKDQKEAAHQKNRRTAFKPISQDYKDLNKARRKR